MSDKLVGVKVFAPAKVNLCLHITGQRDDGYHLLDSLVAFADVGDDLWIQVGNTISLTTEGPEAAAVPADMSNLVLKVAALFRDLPGASFLMTKRLPVASGIGGGSADAAAAFRGLMSFWSDGAVDFASYDPLETPMGADLFALGADIAMCLKSRSVRARGIGDELSDVRLPPVPAVLVNPRFPIATPEIFKRLTQKQNGTFDDLPEFGGPLQLIEWLQEQRNDLESPAIEACPAVAETLAVLNETDDCLLSRMSGSGATCFGLYSSLEEAKAAAQAILARRPHWWVVATTLGDQFDVSVPRIKKTQKS